MLEAYKDYWVRALDFSGKTSRSGYWYAFLVSFIVGVVLAFILPESILNIFLISTGCQVLR